MTYQKPANIIGSNTHFVENLRFVDCFTEWLAGDTAQKVVYTCPAGKNALISVGRGWNHNAGSNTVVFKMNRNGDPAGAQRYYSFSAGSNGGGTTTAPTQTYVLNAGDKLEVSPTLDLFKYYAYALEWDSGYGYPKSVVLTGLSVGDNVVYTCPANTRAVIVSPPGWRSVATVEKPAIYCLNRSGVSVTLKPYFVHSGDPVGVTNQTVITTVVSTGNTGTFDCTGVLEAGDTLVLNSDTASTDMSSWVNLIEYQL